MWVRAVAVVGLLALAPGCSGDDAGTTTARRTQAPVDLVVFLRPQSTTAERESIARRLSQLPGVQAYDFWDQAKSYAEFKTMFAGQPRLLESVTEETLPPSYRVSVESGAVDETTGALTGLPGVLSVVPASSRARPPVTPPGG